jgi:hypothetical protein
MTNWIYFPLSDEPTDLSQKVVAVFESVSETIDSSKRNLHSNEVLAVLSDRLFELGFQVETGKKKEEKIYVPVLFGRNGKLEKSFEADAYHKKEGFVIEVEAGRGVVNKGMYRKVCKWLKLGTGLQSEWQAG